MPPGILDTPTTPFVAQEQKHQQKKGPRWRSAKLQDFKVGPITSYKGGITPLPRGKLTDTQFIRPFLWVITRFITGRGPAHLESLLVDFFINTGLRLLATPRKSLILEGCTAKRGKKLFGHTCMGVGKPSFLQPKNWMIRRTSADKVCN